MTPEAITEEFFRQQQSALQRGAETRDAERYRWLRSEEVATDPRYYEFWNDFHVKLCRESAMDALIDGWMSGELPKAEDE